MDVNLVFCSWARHFILSHHTLYSHSGSLHQVYKWVPANLGGTGDELESHPGGSRNNHNPSRFVLLKPSSGQMGHLARTHFTLPYHLFTTVFAYAKRELWKGWRFHS